LLQFFEAFLFVVRILKRLMELMERIEVASIGGFDYFFDPMVAGNISWGHDLHERSVW
jgi:hypothetical protein